MSVLSRETKKAQEPRQGVRLWAEFLPGRMDCRKAPWRIPPMRLILRAWHRMLRLLAWTAAQEMVQPLEAARRQRPGLEKQAGMALPADRTAAELQRAALRRAASARAGRDALPESVPAAFPEEEAEGTAIFTALRSGLTIRM